MSQSVGYEFKIRPQGMHFSPRLQFDKLIALTERTPLVYLDDLVTLAKSEARQPLTVTIRSAGSKWTYPRSLCATGNKKTRRLNIWSTGTLGTLVLPHARAHTLVKVKIVCGQRNQLQVSANKWRTTKQCCMTQYCFTALSLVTRCYTYIYNSERRDFVFCVLGQLTQCTLLDPTSREQKV